MLPNLQALWRRAHLTPEERKAKKDTLPASRDVAWFRKVFLQPEAPPNLGEEDDVWDHFIGFNEYDGLTAVVAATVSSPKLFGQFFQPFSCKKTGTLVLGQAEGDPGVEDDSLVRELLHDLMVIALGGGGGDWVERISEVGDRSKKKVDLLMFGDFGKDQDDEKALAMAVTLQHVGCLHRISVVSNLGDSKMRARLAKGTLNVLEARDTAVAVGSDGSHAGDTIHEYEFAGCTYLAAEEELFPGTGTELCLEAMRLAKVTGHQLTIVCNSAMTDMAALLDHPGWAEAARGIVSGVVMMGGATLLPGGGVGLDSTAQNNAFDLPSAAKVFDHFSADRETELIVLTRHSAAACQLPRSAFDGSPHALGIRLTTVAKPSLQKLWERCANSKEAREAIKDALPMRCDAAWCRRLTPPLQNRAFTPPLHTVHYGLQPHALQAATPQATGCSPMHLERRFRAACFEDGCTHPPCSPCSVCSLYLLWLLGSVPPSSMTRAQPASPGWMTSGRTSRDSTSEMDLACNHMNPRQQPHVPKATIPYPRLQPHVSEAATPCDRGCKSMCPRLQPPCIQVRRPRDHRRGDAAVARGLLTLLRAVHVPAHWHTHHRHLQGQRSHVVLLRRCTMGVHCA